MSDSLQVTTSSTLDPAMAPSSVEQSAIHIVTMQTILTVTDPLRT